MPAGAPNRVAGRLQGMNWLELRVPPLAVVFITAAGMWALARAIPALQVLLPYRLAVAGVLAVLGISIAVAGVTGFRRARTTVDPRTPEASSTLVRSGVHAYSRNPMYLGMLFLLLGWGAWLANFASLALAVLFVLYLNRFQIAPEERAMARRFGADYKDYLRQVRRWL